MTRGAALLVASLALAGLAHAALPAAVVEVAFALPAEGNADRDLQYTTAPQAFEDALRSFVAAHAAPLLRDGERLAVTFTRVTLAGRYEPWRTAGRSNARIVRDLYPPRIDVEFARVAADGAVVSAGVRKLVDIDFQLNAQAQLSSDPLRYEKPMLAKWMAAEFGPAR